MSRQTKPVDRRMAVERMNCDQRRAEKNRTYAVVGAVCVVALVIVGRGAYPLLNWK